MTEEDLDDILVKLKAYQEYGDDCRDITDWERGFMDDQLERYEKYQERTRWSEKQTAIIDRVYGKLPI